MDFHLSALALAHWARDWADTSTDDVVAILFHDSDDRNSSTDKTWKRKYDAILSGFEAAGFSRGVPMLPRPASEAWFLCALKQDAYQNCARLENRPGNKNAKEDLKATLRKALDAEPSREVLNELVQSGRIDAARIEMPSFDEFRTRLRTVSNLPNET